MGEKGKKKIEWESRYASLGKEGAKRENSIEYAFLLLNILL